MFIFMMVPHCEAYFCEPQLETGTVLHFGDAYTLYQKEFFWLNR